MKYILTFIVIVVVLAVLILAFSQMPIGGFRIYKIQFALTGLWDRMVQFVTSMMDQNDDGTVSKPSSIIITRIEASTDDLEKIVRGEVPCKENFVMTVNDFPVKMGRDNKKNGKVSKLERVVPIVGCFAEDGVSRKHIRLNRNFDSKNKNISYSLENIAECNEIVYYCNDDDIQEEKKYGVLFNNVKGDQDDDERDCLIFKDSITLVLGEAILRFYKKKYYTKIHGFKFKIDSNLYDNGEFGKKETSGIVIPTSEKEEDVAEAITTTPSKNEKSEKKEIVIKKRPKETSLD